MTMNVFDQKELLPIRERKAQEIHTQIAKLNNDLCEAAKMGIEITFQYSRYRLTDGDPIHCELFTKIQHTT